MEKNKEVQKKLFLKYLNYIKEIRLYKKDYRIKKQAMYFFKGIFGAKDLREKLQKLKKAEDIIKEVEKF